MGGGTTATQQGPIGVRLPVFSCRQEFHTIQSSEDAPARSRPVLVTLPNSLVHASDTEEENHLNLLLAAPLASCALRTGAAPGRGLLQACGAYALELALETCMGGGRA